MNAKKQNFLLFNKMWRKKVESFVEGADVVSCDVFDTLIHRKVRKPIDVFRIVSEQILKEEKYLDEVEVVFSFPSLRVYAENKAREHVFAQYGHHEVSLDEIYVNFQKITNCTDSLKNYLSEKEIFVENSITYANPIMLEIVKKALRDGKKIVLCSDMYSSSTEISDRVINAGYPAGLPVIVSCENGCSKHDGFLFDILKKNFSIDEKIVHIGDNIHADINMAQENEIDCLHFTYKDEIDEIFFSHFSKEENDFANCLSHGFARFILISDPEKAHDIWYQSGVTVFGPLFLGYFFWLLDNLQKGEFSKILFLARDGYFFNKMFAKWSTSLGVNIPSEYIYVSRGTLLYPSLSDLNWDRLWFQFGGRRNKTLNGICKKLGIPLYLYLEEAERSGISDINESIESGDARIHKFFVLVGKNLLKDAQNKRKISREYLESYISEGEKIALCDIGWAGNIQGSISRIMRSGGISVDLEGFYFGIFPWSQMNNGLRDVFHGYLVNGSSVQNLNEVLLNGGVELLEFATTAPHGTTLSYTEKNNQIFPVLEQSDDDKRVQTLSASIQEGAWDFVSSMMDLLITMDKKIFLSRSWAEAFINFVQQPTLEEARTFGIVTHSDAPGATLERSHLVSTPASETPEDVEKAKEKSFWKYAFQKLYEPQDL